MSFRIPISVAIHDTLSKEPVYLVDENPKRLIERFVEALTGKQDTIAAEVLKQHPYPSDFQMLSSEVKEQWKQWVNQVPVIGLNSGKYDINMVKEYFVKEISYNKDDECSEDVFAVKNVNDYMFLTICSFKFLDVKNCIGPGLIYDAWCKSMICRLQKLMFPYEWLDSYEKLRHVGPVSFTVALNLLLQGMNTNSFLKCSRKMIASQWVIGCGHITLQTLCPLSKPLRR